MKIIIHDLEELKLDGNYKIINERNIKNCIGCFNCWTKTPMKCIHNDICQNIGKDISNCEELIIISKCIYGSYSSKVKKVLERCISSVYPFFEIRKGEIHHKLRNNRLKLTVYFYGDISHEDKTLAIKLVNSNCKNFGIDNSNLKFYKKVEEIGEIC